MSLRSLSGEDGPVREALNVGNRDVVVASSALGAAGVSLVETEIQLYTSFQPARPTYDIGVDLRAISADGERGVNIQVKASSARTFTVQGRWGDIPNFLIVYIWELRLRRDASVYVLSYEEAQQIIRSCAPRWLRTRSWCEIGAYSTTNPSAAIRTAIEQYRATPERWHSALTTAARHFADKNATERQ